MRIIARKTLRNYWEKHKNCENPLKAWFHETRRADWRNFNELKQQFHNASIVGSDRVVFNIKGNDHRLVVKIDFAEKKIFIRFIGTHNEYDNIDAAKI